jgi:RNA polymerase sigma-70 factor (ECF subfamily)
MRICGNVARTHLRKRHVHQPILSEDEVPSQGDASSHSDLMSLITTLTVEHRTVVTLCLVLGFTYEEAAEILEVPIGTVRSRLFRARESLARDMADVDTTRDMAV